MSVLHPLRTVSQSIWSFAQTSAQAGIQPPGKGGEIGHGGDPRDMALARLSTIDRSREAFSRPSPRIGTSTDVNRTHHRKVDRFVDLNQHERSSQERYLADAGRCGTMKLWPMKLLCHPSGGNVHCIRHVTTGSILADADLGTTIFCRGRKPTLPEKSTISFRQCGEIPFGDARISIPARKGRWRGRLWSRGWWRVRKARIRTLRSPGSSAPYRLRERSPQ